MKAWGLAASRGMRLLSPRMLPPEIALLKAIDAVIGLRVSADEETEGLDVVLHDERAYDI